MKKISVHVLIPRQIRILNATDQDSLTPPDFEKPLKIDSVNDTTPCQWSINLETAGKHICYKIDTGAQVNVLQKKYFDKLQTPSPVEDHLCQALCL